MLWIQLRNQDAIFCWGGILARKYFWQQFFLLLASRLDVIWSGGTRTASCGKISPRMISSPRPTETSTSSRDRSFSTFLLPRASRPTLLYPSQDLPSPRHLPISQTPRRYPGGGTSRWARSTPASTGPRGQSGWVSRLRHVPRRRMHRRRRATGRGGAIPRLQFRRKIWKIVESSWSCKGRTGPSCNPARSWARRTFRLRRWVRARKLLWPWWSRTDRWCYTPPRRAEPTRRAAGRERPLSCCISYPAVPFRSRTAGPLPTLEGIPLTGHGEAKWAPSGRMARYRLIELKWQWDGVLGILQ